jgi:hypothetical protein
MQVTFHIFSPVLFSDFSDFVPLRMPNSQLTAMPRGLHAAAVSGHSKGSLKRCHCVSEAKSRVGLQWQLWKPQNWLRIRWMSIKPMEIYGNPEIHGFPNFSMFLHHSIVISRFFLPCDGLNWCDVFYASKIIQDFQPPLHNCHPGHIAILKISQNQLCANQLAASESQFMFLIRHLSTRLASGSWAWISVIDFTSPRCQGSSPIRLYISCNFSYGFPGVSCV